MKKDKLRNLLMSPDIESVNLGIIMGKEVLSENEKLSVFSYIAKKYPATSISIDGVYISLTDDKVPLLSSVAIEYRKDIMSFKITKDGTKKFNRSANRVRRTRKSRAGTDTSKSS